MNQWLKVASFVRNKSDFPHLQVPLDSPYSQKNDSWSTSLPPTRLVMFSCRSTMWSGLCLYVFEKQFHPAINPWPKVPFVMSFSQFVMLFSQQFGNKVGENQFRGKPLPTYVYPVSLKQAIRTVIDADLQDYPDPETPAVGFVLSVHC